MRAFVAVKLSPLALDELQSLSEDLRISHKNISWTKRDNMHVTLRFLGNVPIKLLDQFSACAIEALSRLSPATLHARGLGAFPNSEKPRVLWIGLAGDLNALAKLNRATEDCATQAGLESEPRPFKPHITLARLRAPRVPPTLRDSIRRHAEFRGSAFRVDSVTLFSSTLTPSGPVYQKLQEYPLGC